MVFNITKSLYGHLQLLHYLLAALPSYEGSHNGHSLSHVTVLDLKQFEHDLHHWKGLELSFPKM